MNGWDKPICKVHGMLKTIDKNIPWKTPQVLMIRARQDKKKKQGKNSKGKPQAGKGKGKKDPQNPPPKKKKNVAKYNTCFECGFVGHWKRNSPKYLVELKNKKFWDGISRVSKKTRELKTDEMLLHVGNGARVAL
ncbi:uncharacterized protein LOC111881462 [Lactuca sativa]|uniref:uncharacterized protein LOC111881462 n=1 Tax=Lactuca sativa TaxID=4236 RepID=UPI000CD9F8E2|nr:uncharacterized protein LOC111881462 [Lactuca sativa]